MGGADDTAPLAELLDERQHLIDVARWMLGAGAAAEEAVTDTYRRWYRLTDDERTGIEDPRIWLTKSMGSICLARLSTPGRRLPDPDDGDAGLEPGPALSETISGVLLDALDALSPAERAVFVLNDVFAMPPPTVADIVGRTPRECAQLADRARSSLRADRAHPTLRISTTGSSAPSGRPAHSTTRHVWCPCCPGTRSRSSTAAARSVP